MTNYLNLLRMITYLISVSMFKTLDMVIMKIDSEDDNWSGNLRVYGMCFTLVIILGENNDFCWWLPTRLFHWFIAQILGWYSFRGRNLIEIDYWVLVHIVIVLVLLVHSKRTEHLDQHGCLHLGSDLVRKELQGNWWSIGMLAGISDTAVNGWIVLFGLVLIIVTWHTIMINIILIGMRARWRRERTHWTYDILVIYEFLSLS
jgi:hypothetical protein